jgi:hypothetical protein
VTNSPITKNGFCKKKRRVSSTPNAYLFGLQFLRRGRCVGHSILPRNCTLQRASRLRKTYFFDKLHFPTSVSSTPNAHFENQVSSRLHQMLVFLKYDISSTPNTYFGKRIRHLAETRMLISGKTIGNALCKMASRLHETHIVKTGTFHRASRLHQMHIRKIECRLAYGKCYLF